MIINFFKTGFRNIQRSKGYSAINIGGLAVGMGVTMLIGLWIYDELSFNKYYKNHDSIASIWGGGIDPQTSEDGGAYAMAQPTETVLKNNYGHLFKHVMIGWWMGDYTLAIGDKKFTRKGEFMGSGAPDMLSLEMKQGTYSCLNDPHSIILSASTAKAMFGNEDPINKAIRINNRLDVKVTGVYKDIPRNNRFSDVMFFSPWDLWKSANNWIQQNENNWDNRSFPIYVQLQPNVTFEQVNAALKDLYVKNSPPDYYKEIEKYKPFASAVPMNSWHLYSDLKHGKPAGGRITFVWLFGIIGLFVLLLACINFMNLSTARAANRAKEVGIRKAVGSLKGQLIRQFLGESLLVVLVASVIAFILVISSISWFNGLADKEMTVPVTNIFFWMMLGGFILLTSFLAGLYPAFYLSSFRPVKVLKGVMKAGRFASIPRKALVILQFSVSVILIIGTIIVYQQIQHARNRPTGYNREGLLSIPLNDPEYIGKTAVIKTELLKTGVVTDMALSSNPLTAVWNNSGGFSWRGRNPDIDNDFAICNISHEYGKTVQWELKAGRDFSKDMKTDTASIILNETAAKYIGLKNPVGERITSLDSDDNGRSWTIIGIVKDVVMDSPYEPVKQTLFFLDGEGGNISMMELRLKPGINANEAISKIQAVFKQIVPTASFDYKFVDDEYGTKFSQEVRIGKLAGFFAVLAIFISCLGLFGLASFVAQQRSKEIGIRKVVGASVFDLWKMLSKDFVLLVIISCVVAIPVAYYYMSGWLQKYQYRAAPSWWIFAAAVGGALLITLITVSFQAIRAAMANPVKSLRAE